MTNHCRHIPELIMYVKAKLLGLNGIDHNHTAGLNREKDFDWDAYYSNTGSLYKLYGTCEQVRPPLQSLYGDPLH